MVCGDEFRADKQKCPFKVSAVGFTNLNNLLINAPYHKNLPCAPAYKFSINFSRMGGFLHIFFGCCGSGEKMVLVFLVDTLKTPYENLIS